VERLFTYFEKTFQSPNQVSPWEGSDAGSGEKEKPDTAVIAVGAAPVIPEKIPGTKDSIL